MKNRPILISIPHSSVFVPIELRRNMNLTNKEIVAHADLATDVIFDIPDVYKVIAKINRLVVDPNRAPDDIEMETKLGAEGVVVAVSEDKKPIYKRVPSLRQISDRVKKYHDSFHDEIDSHKAKVRFLIDGHSCKSVGPMTKPDAGQRRPDIILGNRHFTTCSREQTAFFMNFFRKKGLSVDVNKPYSGKYILGYHCSRRHLPGIQVEINRALYMNENTLRVRKKDVEKLNLIIRELVDELSSSEFL